MDLIDRQAAIDAIYHHLPSVSRMEVRLMLHEVPSAQSETHDKRTETHACDLISRQAAIDEVKKEMLERDGRFYKGLLVANHVILHLPSVQPQACDDAISRDDAIMAVKTGALSAATIFGRTDEGATAYYETVKAIKALPSAQPERMKGKWIKLDMHAHLADHKCTACDQECYVPTCMGEPMYNYCPNCGADMRGDDE